MLTLSRTQVALLLVPLVVLLTVAGSRFAGAGASSGPAAVAPLARVGGAGSAARTPLLFVHVVGAVRRAGLFRLRDGSRVADAGARAGGPTGSADAVGAGGPGSGVKVSLASATIEQLDELPGVGPVTAQKIVDWRTTHGPFRSVDDLDDVPGIGPARIEQLRDLVTP